MQIFDGEFRKYGDFEAVRVRVHGARPWPAQDSTACSWCSSTACPKWTTSAMAPARPYLKKLVDRYVDAGVVLNGLYSDEMHIQQDWGYGLHLENGEFALKYVSPGLAARYAALYGEQYRTSRSGWCTLSRARKTPACAPTPSSKCSMSRRPFAGARQAALFRARYYHLLQDGVVDSFTKAKHYAEMRMGHRFQARAHATWRVADHRHLGLRPGEHERAEVRVHPHFLRSNTVQQASAACADYFKWGDFLTGNGTDHPEGGWLDRDYYGLALASSIGVLNEVPYAYCAHWACPTKSRAPAVRGDAYGGGWGPNPHTTVQDMQHRDIEVLMLYPVHLVAVNERFGSWMAQYGYANYITAAKLLEQGPLKDGAIEVAGRRFTTLCTLFEPFPKWNCSIS